MNEWFVREDKLVKHFEFDDFKSSLKFVNMVGDLAEKASHHPDITFGWGYAEITLFTHSENAITGKDKSLAQEIDNLMS